MVPRVKLLQSVSPEVTEFAGASAGTFWNTLEQKSYGDSFSFSVLSFRPWCALMAPIDDAEGRGILARALDNRTWDQTGSWEIRRKGMPPVTWKITNPNVEASGLLKFGSSNPADKNSPPAAVQFYDYLIRIMGEETPLVMSLARTNIAIAKKTLNSALSAPNVPRQTMKFTANAVNRKDGAYTYFVYSFTRAGHVSEQDYNLNTRLIASFQDSWHRAESPVVEEPVVDNEGANAV